MESSQQSETPAETPAPESYLAAARRAAIASAVAVEKAPKRERGPKRSSRGMLVLLGCAAPVAIVATAIFFINRNSLTASPLPADAAPEQAAAAPEQTAPVNVAELVSPPELVLSPLTDPSPAPAASTTTFEGLTAKAASGDAAAERELGLKYLAGDGIAVDEAEAASWLISAAYKGEATAEYWLATLYQRGHGVPADSSQASHWFQAAAKHGNGQAMMSLALANLGTDDAQAAQWFQKAAELGLRDAQFNLAVLHDRGTGVTQNLSEAYKWYSVAAAQGSTDAAARAAALAKVLKPEDLATARAAAESFKPAVPNETANAANAKPQDSGG